MKQEIHNLGKKQDSYMQLSENAILLLEKADIPNWNMLATMSSTTISRFLNLDFIYRLAMDKPGHIYEFGCHYGTSTAILRNLRDLYEPRNVSRGIVTFDTFQGFSKVVPEDGDWNKSGDFGLEIKNYKSILQNILEAQRQISGTLNLYRHDSIVEGDVSITLNKFLAQHSNHIINCAIFDMDVYQATQDALEAIKPHLAKDAILVFDELIHDHYPGEALALKDSEIFNKLDFIKGLPHVPYCAIAKYKG